MSAALIDGTRVASAILSETAEQATAFERAVGRKACLATVLVGDDPASHTYVRMKTNRCRSTGLDSRSHHLAATATTGDVVNLVSDLSANHGVDGILVQHPLPPHIDEREVFEDITPGKDVDGVTSTSFAAMALVHNGFHSCSDWIKRDAVVIDAGYNAGNVGDIEYAAAAERASHITPVPGGVGPTTIAVPLSQTVLAATRTASGRSSGDPTRRRASECPPCAR